MLGLVLSTLVLPFALLVAEVVVPLALRLDPLGMLTSGTTGLRGGALLPVAFVGCLGCGMWAAWVTPQRANRTTLQVTLPGLDPDLDGYRILHISDLHMCGMLTEAMLQRWQAACLKARPDLVLFSGDLSLGAAGVDAGAEWLAGCSSEDGVYAVLGNHDGLRTERVTEALEANGVVVLDNSARQFGPSVGGFRLVGVGDRNSGGEDLERALDSGDPTAPTILLAHDPDVFDHATQRGVAITLAGHTHAGQVTLPGAPRWLAISRIHTHYVRGLYEREGARLYVNAGLGVTGLPLRWCSTPELLTVVLRAEG